MIEFVFGVLLGAVLGWSLHRRVSLGRFWGPVPGDEAKPTLELTDKDKV